MNTNYVSNHSSIFLISTNLYSLLAGHMITDNSIAKPIPGFVPYNVAENIINTDFSAWSTRWLLCQKLTLCSIALDIRGGGGIFGERRKD